MGRNPSDLTLAVIAMISDLIFDHNSQGPLRRI
jgi:hypothetical protein